VNPNLFMAAFWAVIGIIILALWPSNEQNPAVGVASDQRVWMAGVTLVLVGYNLVRWHLPRLRRQADGDVRRPPVRPRREEPPNPDFDFSDPKPGDGPQPPP
jgi:hypothetical protein